MTRAGFRLLGVVAAVALVTHAPTSAQARTDLMEYSEDGVTWHDTPPAALFEEGIVLVPGGSTSETLHLRSRADTLGLLTLSFLNAAASSEAAAEAFGVSIAKVSSSDAFVSPERQQVAELQDQVATSPGIRLEPGKPVAITVTVDLDAGVTGSVAQNSSIALDLSFRIVDATVGTGEPGTEDGDGSGNRPETGGGPATLPPALVIPVVPEGSHEVPVADVADETPGNALAPRGGIGSTGPVEPASEPSLPGGLAVTGIQRGLLLLTGSVLAVGGLLVAVGRTRRRQP